MNGYRKRKNETEKEWIKRDLFSRKLDRKKEWIKENILSMHFVSAIHCLWVLHFYTMSVIISMCHRSADSWSRMTQQIFVLTFWWRRKQKVDSDPHGHQLLEMCITGGKALCRSQLCLWLTPDTLRLLSVLVLRPLPPAALAPPTPLTAPGYPSRRGWVNDLRVTMIYWPTPSKDCFLSNYLLSSPELS